MTDEEWLDSVPSNRRPILSRAMQLWHTGGWSSKYESFNSFIKEEFLPYFDKDGLDLVPLRAMVDRLINAPHDVTHCIAGPKIKPYMKWLKQQWNHTTHLFYAGCDPDYVQAWLARATSFGCRLCFWSDYSMFDASHNSETWAFVEAFYDQYKHDVWFNKVLDVWRTPNGTIGDLKYQGRVMNASGRDDTALANAILNGVAMLLSVTAAWFKVPLSRVTRAHLELIKNDLQLGVCGDDALGFLPPVSEPEARGFINRARANLTMFGFKAKMFCSHRFEDAVFLGHRPIQVGGAWYWAKTLGRCLYKMGYQRGLSGDPGAHFNGICQMVSTVSAHVPILSDIAREWLAARKGSKVNAFKADLEHRPWQQLGRFGPKHYDAQAIASIARAYSIEADSCRGDLTAGGLESLCVTPGDVVECISHVVRTIRASGGTPCVLDHWLLRHMVAVDEL